MSFDPRLERMLALLVTIRAGRAAELEFVSCLGDYLRTILPEGAYGTSKSASPSDIRQQAWIKLKEALIEQFENDNPAALADYIRVAVNHLKADGVKDPATNTVGLADDQALSARGPSVSSAARSHDRAEMVQMVIARTLPEADRILFWLHELKETSGQWPPARLAWLIGGGSTAEHITVRVRAAALIAEADRMLYKLHCIDAGVVKWTLERLADLAGGGETVTTIRYRIDKARQKVEQALRPIFQSEFD